MTTASALPCLIEELVAGHGNPFHVDARCFSLHYSFFFFSGVFFPFLCQTIFLLLFYFLYITWNIAIERWRMEVVKILGLNVSVEFELVPDINFDSEETMEGPLSVIQRDHVIL
jgi:hypothetical protein